MKVKIKKISYVFSLVVLLVVFTVLDVVELRAARMLALGDPFQVPEVLGPAVAGRAEDKLGSLCRLDEGEPLDPRFLWGAVFAAALAVPAPASNTEQVNA